MVKCDGVRRLQYATYAMLREISPNDSCMSIGDISRHAFLVLRVSTLPSRAVTQTLRALGRGWVMSRERRGREQFRDHGCPNVVCLEFTAPMSHDTSFYIRLATSFS
jgi:hypothetical protein